MTRTRSVRLADALRVGEFRALWAAETISVAGDQLARVALSLLVFDRTSSAALTGLTYALTFAPAFLGGLLLSGFADRFPRRGMIITIDVLRCCLAGAMAIPGLPLGVLWALVGLLALAAAPYKAAQLALLPQVLEGDRYISGMALRQVSNQAAQIVGFSVGGALVVALTAQGALLVNAGTFTLSVLLVVLGVRGRPASAKSDAKADGETEAPVGRVRLVPVFLLASLVGLWVVPEGLAAPYANALEAAAFTVGLLMAADPIGSVVGAWLATKMVRPPTVDSIFWPAALAGIPLVACWMHPGVWISAVLWALSGAASTIFLIRLQAHVVDVVPDSRRGKVLGRISTCLQTSQGLAILGGGVLAEQAGPFIAVASAGAFSVAIVVVVASVWGRARPRDGDEQQPGQPGQMSLLPTSTSWERQSPRDPAPGDDGTGSGHGSPTSMPTPIEPAQPPARGHVASWALWSRPRTAVIYILTICAAAGLLAVSTLATQGMGRDQVVMAFGILGLGVLAAEISRRVERMRRIITDAPHVNLSSVWTMSSAVVLPSGLASVAVIVLYSHLWFRSWRELPQFHTFRMFFNVSNVILCVQATAWLVDRIHLHPDDLSRPWVMLGQLVVVIAFYFVLNSAIAAVAIGLLQPDRTLVRLLGKPSENLLELATLCMAALAVLLLNLGAPLVLLIYLPLYALHRSVLVRQFEHDAMADAKTGLLNAISWQNLAVKELDRVGRRGSTASVLIVEVDGAFGDDETGQLAWDSALRAVAATLETETRNYDLVGRLGDYEFAVLLPGVDRNSAMSVADRIRAAVRQKVVDGVGHLSVTIGAADFPATSDLLEELLVASYNALFAAGPNRVRAVKRY